MHQREEKYIQAFSHRGGPVSIPDQFMWDLWWTKWHWDRFSPSSSVFPSQFHSIITENEKKN
jgi:hypothetical protein